MFFFSLTQSCGGGGGRLGQREEKWGEDEIHIKEENEDKGENKMVLENGWMQRKEVDK